jgi:hypothetical protein
MVLDLFSKLKNVKGKDTERPPSYEESLPIHRWKQEAKLQAFLERQETLRILDNYVKEAIDVMDGCVKKNKRRVHFMIVNYPLDKWAYESIQEPLYRFSYEPDKTKRILRFLRTPEGIWALKQSVKTLTGIKGSKLQIINSSSNVVDFNGKLLKQNVCFTQFTLNIL